MNAMAHQTDGSPERQNCHRGDGADTDPVQVTENDSDETCCDAEGTCAHDDCSCVCPVMGHAVPMRRLGASRTPHHQLWMDSGAEAPRHITSTLLRPPRS